MSLQQLTEQQRKYITNYGYSLNQHCKYLLSQQSFNKFPGVVDKLPEQDQYKTKQQNGQIVYYRETDFQYLIDEFFTAWTQIVDHLVYKIFNQIPILDKEYLLFLSFYEKAKIMFNDDVLVLGLNKPTAKQGIDFVKIKKFIQFVKEYYLPSQTSQDAKKKQIQSAIKYLEKFCQDKVGPERKKTLNQARNTLNNFRKDVLPIAQDNTLTKKQKISKMRKLEPLKFYDSKINLGQYNKVVRLIDQLAQLYDKK